MQLRHTAQAIGGAAHHRVNSKMSGLYASVFHGQGMEFEEVREYQEGDDVRNMDWRVTARTGKPHLKIFKEERERSVHLCIDVGAHMAFGTRGVFKIVQAAKIAALLGWQANHHGDRVGSLLFGRELDHLAFHRPVRSSKALWQTLKVMTELDQYATDENDDIVGAINKLTRAAHHGSLIFLIVDSNYLGGDFDQAIRRLASRHEVVVIAVDDAADYQLPPMGRARFRNAAGQQLVVDCNDAGGRRRYAESWQARRDLLLSNAAKFRYSVIPVNTHDDVQEVFTHSLQRRMQHAS